MQNSFIVGIVQSRGNAYNYPAYFNNIVGVNFSDLLGDALLVIKRICEQPAESIEQRCRALQMDRASEFRARAKLDARGLIEKTEQSAEGKIRFFRPTGKGIDWARKRDIRIKKFKSGIVHEYILSQVEKRIGSAGSKWRLQRNSSIARDQGLQPDLLVLGPEGLRVIVEVCCSNLTYDANNILIESAIPGIDRVIAVTPDKKTKDKLSDALRGKSQDVSDDSGTTVTLLDAGQCLADDFDWKKVLTNNHGKLFPG